MLRSILYLILIIIVALIQLSLARFWKWGELNLILVLVIFTAALLGTRAFWWAFFGGIVLDLYSLSPFGTLTFILLTVSLISYFLTRSVLTRRSLVSLLLVGLICIFTYNLLHLLLNQLFFLLKLTSFHIVINRANLIYLFRHLALNLIFLAVLFLAAKFSSRKLKNIFIFKERIYQA